MTIGQTIKLYRKEKNFTQGQLAELIGVSAQAISKWETDAGMPDISLKCVELNEYMLRLIDGFLSG